MNATLTIAKRELTSLFYSPIAYLVLGLFALGTSLIFFLYFYPGQPAALQPTLHGVIWLMIFLVPAISMRMLSEEYRSGTIESLMTAPVSDTHVVLGKWLGAMGFFLALLTPLFALAVVLALHSRPDFGPILTGLLGLLLVGGLYLAIGTFASAATENQIIAFLLTVFIICMFTIMLYFLPMAGFVGPDLRQALFYLNVNAQFEDFTKGLIDLTNFVYFFSGIALFLFLAVKVLESKRWR
jgi:ABC-2 type transport system permease protein